MFTPRQHQSRWFFRWSTPTAPTKTIEVQRVQVDELFQILRGGEELEETEPRGPMCHLVTQKELSEVPHESRGAILVSDMGLGKTIYFCFSYCYDSSAVPLVPPKPPMPTHHDSDLLRSILLNVCGECRRLLHQHHHPPPRQSEGSKWPRT